MLDVADQSTDELFKWRAAPAVSAVERLACRQERPLVVVEIGQDQARREYRPAQERVSRASLQAVWPA